MNLGVAVLLLAGVLGVLGSPAYAGGTVTAGSLSLTPSTGSPGALVVATGKVPPRVRHPVRLQRKEPAGWTTVASGRTNARGKYSLSTRLPSDRGSAQFRVHSPAVRDPETGRKKAYVTPVRSAVIQSLPAPTPPPTPAPTPPTPPTPPAPPGDPSRVLVARQVTQPPGVVADLSLAPEITQVTSVGSVTSPPGLSLEVGAGGGDVALSVASTVPAGSATVVVDGTGCVDETCGIAFRATVGVTVTSLAESTVAVDELPMASPDRRAAAETVGAVGGVSALSDEVVVVLGSDDAPGTVQDAQDVAVATGLVVTGALESAGIYQLRWADGRSAHDVRLTLEAQPGVAGVDRSTYFPAVTAAEPAEWAGSDAGGSAKKWPYKAMRAPQAWNLTTGGGDGPIVGVLDPAPAHEHSELRMSYAFPEERDRGNAWITPDQEERDNISHATHVSGTACAIENGTGVAGVGWGCKVVSAAVTRTWDSISSAGYTQVLMASNVLMGRGARVINMSFGWNFPQSDNACSSAEQSAEIKALPTDAGVRHAMSRLVSSPLGRETLFTVAAGNGCLPFATQMTASLSSRSNVIIVGASNADGTLASFSNYGEHVEVAAPGGVNAAGVGVWSTARTGYVQLSGTSMAAPLVAGLANLVWSKHPGFSAAEVGDCIVETAGSGPAGSVTARSSQPDSFDGLAVDPEVAFTGTLPIVDAYNAVKCEVSAPGNWTSIAAGRSHTCALAVDDSAWCWGYNGSGS